MLFVFLGFVLFGGVFSSVGGVDCVELGSGVMSSLRWVSLSEFSSTDRLL